MTIKLSSLKANLAREEKGDWIDYPDWPGVAFKVSSLHLESYQVARDLLFKELAAQYGAKPVPKAVLVPRLGLLYVEHILHDWKGFDIPFSAETARKELGVPEGRNLVAAVEWCAGRVSEVKLEFVGAETKNSEESSASA